MNFMRFRAVATTAALLALGACGDAPTEPAALLVAEHARAALDRVPGVVAVATANTLPFPGGIMNETFAGGWSRSASRCARARRARACRSRTELSIWS